MSDRELLALMAATIYGGTVDLTKEQAIGAAEKILAEIDARAAARREPALPECPPKP